MLERDYIMRLLQSFFNDLNILIHGKQYLDDEQKLNAIEGLYRQYLKIGRAYFHESTIEGLLASYKTDPNGAVRAEILASLLYQEALLQPVEGKALLEKALALYQFVNEISKDYSSERTEVIREIEKILS